MSIPYTDYNKLFFFLQPGKEPALLQFFDGAPQSSSKNISLPRKHGVETTALHHYWHACEKRNVCLDILWISLFLQENRGATNLPWFTFNLIPSKFIIRNYRLVKPEIYISDEDETAL